MTTEKERFDRRQKIVEEKLTAEEKKEFSKFDTFEQYAIADYLGRGMPYKEAVVTYGNSVEGDFTQLSKTLLKAYKKYDKEEYWIQSSRGDLDSD
jgi:hypothetical protein